MSKTSYPKHSVGQHLIHTSLVFDRNARVSHVLSSIEHKAKSWPNSEYVYVVDGNKKLVGVVEFKKLLNAKGTQALDYLMETKFHSVTDHTHQENAAKLAVKEDLETIPVVDVHGHFLGIIDAAQIFKILHEVHVEKLMHFSGVLDTEGLSEGYKTNVLTSVSARLPSLIIGLVGGFFSITIIENYAHTLRSELILAFFIPIIVYMNAAVGNQIQTIFVRFSAFEKVKIGKAFWHELKVSFIVALVLSGMMFLLPHVLYQNPLVAVIVSVSMFFGIISSVFIGIFVPWSLQKLGYDPAIGSGPFTTILQDLLSIFIYFYIATLLL